MSLKLSGRIYRIEDREQITETFTKREFAIETDGQYPQKVLFQTVNDRCDILDPYKVGQNVTVYFDIRGNEVSSGAHQGRIFNNINAWKIEAKQEQQFFTPPAPTSAPFPDESDMPI